MMRFFAILFLLPAALAPAQTVLFDGSAFPELVGWQRDERLFPPERWIESGWFVQQTEMNQNPYEPEDDAYRRSISEFAGVPAFFAEWRMVTDGSRAGIPDVAPAALTASGTTGVFYHFTISEDQTRLINSQLDVIFFDIQIGTPHTYRLEVHQRNYAVFVDEQQVYVGTTALDYPTSDSVIVFGARAPGETATTRWDYIRYGRIPQADPGDTNCDGAVNFFDIDPFIVALFDADGYGQQYPACTRDTADVNGDAHVDFFDIDPFVSCLFGGCP